MQRDQSGFGAGGRLGMVAPVSRVSQARKSLMSLARSVWSSAATWAALSQRSSGTRTLRCWVLGASGM